MPEDWDGGWWKAAQRLPSPNRDARPAGTEPDLLVLHSISLPPGRYGGTEVAQLFNNQLDCDAHPYFDALRGLRVSSHFVVRRDGGVQQFVDTAERAWHAGASRWRGRERCNDDSIGIELEGLEHTPFEPAQYAALIRLVRALALRWPVCHIAGHEHVAPGRKEDPGGAFDWDALAKSLAWDPRCFPPQRASHQ